MPDTSPSTIDPADLSAPVQSLLAAAAVNAAAAEFPSAVQAKLTGIALAGRDFADRFLDSFWSDQNRRQPLLAGGIAGREVIIGSGFHAAVYAAVRVLNGFPKPLVLERADRIGGAFAMTTRPTFYLNSRNRGGSAGLAGDQGASLNYLPGAPIQAANVSMAEYQTNTDMAFVIRLTLAQYASVVPGTEVTSVTRNGTAMEVNLSEGGPLTAGRLIDARGLGDPTSPGSTNGTTILTFPQLMQRMAGMWPLRGLRRVAVVGGGDSAKCAVESLLGIAPPPFMAAAALDRVDRIDWYADDLPSACEQWQEGIRGRYQAIGRYLRPDRFGAQRLTVMGRRARPVALPGTVLIDGRTYDLAVVCIGFVEKQISGLDGGDFDEFPVEGGMVVARRHYTLPAYRVGPHARLPFTTQERGDGLADIPANAVAMFRTATKTAALAATLGAVNQD